METLVHTITIYVLIEKCVVFLTQNIRNTLETAFSNVLKVSCSLFPYSKPVTHDCNNQYAHSTEEFY